MWFIYYRESIFEGAVEVASVATLEAAQSLWDQLEKEGNYMVSKRPTEEC